VLRYSRPQSLNPLNVAVRREMAEHLNALAEDDGVRVVVLAGTEKAFAAGADLVEMSKADAVEMHGWNTAKSWKAIVPRRCMPKAPNRIRVGADGLNYATGRPGEVTTTLSRGLKSAPVTV
jgi:enoyl-CoA hydratase/carnithine racemase